MMKDAEWVRENLYDLAMAMVGAKADNNKAVALLAEGAMLAFVWLLDDDHERQFLDFTTSLEDNEPLAIAMGLVNEYRQKYRKGNS